MPSLTNGDIKYSGMTFGEIATFVCDDGYRLIGDESAECQDNGQWSNSLPTCASNSEKFYDLINITSHIHNVMVFFFFLKEKKIIFKKKTCIM